MHNKLSFFVYATLLAACLLKLLGANVPQKDRLPLMDVMDVTDSIYVRANENDLGPVKNGAPRLKAVDA